MRFWWRTEGTPLSSYAAWIDRIDEKNRQPGTSAPTLAAVWSGPLDVFGALGTHPALTDLVLQHVTVEAKTTFDRHGGNMRNHDVVLRAQTAAGEPVVVCVEAKAGEPLGATVVEQQFAAQAAKDANPNSNALARLSDLVERFCRYPIEDERVGSLRYQLLTAWAGTLIDAADADHAVFVLHEFRTDERSTDKSRDNGAALALFADTVLGCELPGHGDVPWCVRVPDVGGVAAALYLAHVVTDLRRVRLRPEMS